MQEVAKEEEITEEDVAEEEEAEREIRDKEEESIVNESQVNWLQSIEAVAKDILESQNSFESDFIQMLGMCIEVQQDFNALCANFNALREEKLEILEYLGRLEEEKESLSCKIELLRRRLGKENLNPNE
ncbi:hypothetical protein F8M41_017983 [Gigaspora margarita]|uniref:Uncharacterized protein n=1 Tax=Gigaspora margarita TaxID=4874 RepID=A0A8H4ELR7_GIGMA|nr:hypothetical protein F8M41_017983 [Gigaspora margarita]